VELVSVFKSEFSIILYLLFLMFYFFFYSNLSINLNGISASKIHNFILKTSLLYVNDIYRTVGHTFRIFSVARSSKRNITINYYQYREESHNSQLPAERIIYAKLEAPRDYVTTQGNKKVEGQPFIYSTLVSGYPAIRMHQKKLHSVTPWFIIRIQQMFAR